MSESFATKSVSRTYQRATNRPYIPGFGADGDDFDVTSFLSDHDPVRFIPKKGRGDQFFLNAGTWELLGSPNEIKITVEAA